MDVGLYFDLPQPGLARGLEAAHSFTLEAREEADRLGIDSLGSPSTTCSTAGYLPQPLTFASAVAARGGNPHRHGRAGGTAATGGADRRGSGNRRSGERRTPRPRPRHGLPTAGVRSLRRLDRGPLRRDGLQGPGHPRALGSRARCFLRPPRTGFRSGWATRVPRCTAQVCARRGPALGEPQLVEPTRRSHRRQATTRASARMAGALYVWAHGRSERGPARRARDTCGSRTTRKSAGAMVERNGPAGPAARRSQRKIRASNHHQLHSLLLAPAGRGRCQGEVEFIRRWCPP